MNVESNPSNSEISIKIAHLKCSERIKQFSIQFITEWYLSMNVHAKRHF